MILTGWRQWLRRLKQSVYGKPRVKALRRARLDVEALEDRVTPSSAAFQPLYTVIPSHHVMTPAGLYYDPIAQGYTPLGIETAYGVTSLFSAGDEGAGQTIAVVDAYDDPFFVSTGAGNNGTISGFSESDLAAFDSIYGLQDPPSFTKVGQGTNYSPTFSQATLPTTDPSNDWEGEEALDVEWAHAIAPKANIILVECTDSTSLFDGVQWAETPVAQGGGGATVISMSFGTSGGYTGENADDSNFNPAANPGVTFLASSDDQGSGFNGTPNDGSETTGQAAYPSDSPYVVSVGGTSLNLSQTTGAYISEGVWNDGLEPNNNPPPANDYEATGGGISFYESQPAYQYGLTYSNGASTGLFPGNFRAAPDVSFLADPQTGVAVYDTYDGNGTFTSFADPSNLTAVGGTSLSSPCWAGLVAIADQIRVNDGEPTLTGATETLPTLYNIYNSSAYSTDFHNVTGPDSFSGIDNNGTYAPGIGYNLVTGIGTPQANNLVPALADVHQLVYTAPLSTSAPFSTTNNFLLQKNGANLDLYDNSNLVASDPIAEVTSVDIAGQTDNALTIDYTGISTNIAVTFDGGSGNGSGLAHTLTLEGGTFTNETYTYSGSSGGAIDLDGQSVTYTDVASSSNTTTVSNLSIDLPAGAQATLQAGTPADEITGTGFVTSGFEDPSSSLTVSTGGGSSVVSLGAMDSGFQPTTETFSGVAGDIFRFTNAGAVSTLTSLTVSTVSLDLNGFSPTINGLNGDGTITDATSSAPTLTVGENNGGGNFAGVIQDGSGTVAFTKTGNGTQILSGPSSYSGQTTVNAGTLADGAANALPTDTTLDVTLPGTFDLAGANQQVAGVTGSGIVTDSNSTASFTVAEAGADTFAGTIIDAVELVAAGSGTLILTNANNTYTGGTSINTNATLQIGNGTSSGSGGADDIADSGTLQFDSAATSSASPFIFANGITGAGIISAISGNNGDLGAVEVTANNSGFTGSLSITGGSYQLGAADALGNLSNISVSGTGQFYFGLATSLTVNASVTISTTGYTDSAGTVGPLGAIRFAGANDILAGAVTVTGTALVSAFSARSGTIQGIISGTGTLDVGSGLSAETIILTGSDSATTQINASATLQVGNGGAVGALTATTVTDNGSLVFNRTDATVVTVAANIGGNTSGTLKQAGTDTVKLTGASTYGGATTVASGVLEVDGSITSAVTVAANATLTGTGPTGAVTADASGNLYLGSAVSSLSSSGALNLQASSTFNVRIASDASASSVTASSVILGTGVTLNLSAASFNPLGGDEFIIVENTGVSAVSGAFIAGTGMDAVTPGTILTPGTVLSNNYLNSGHVATITYTAGANHDSVAIVISTTSPLSYTGGTDPNVFVLTQSGANLILDDNGIQVASQAVIQTSIVQIGVATGQDATLTIDYSGGQFTNSVIFDGGTGNASHTVTLENGTFTTASFTDNSASSGTIALDAETISYSHVTSIADTTNEGNVVFTLPAGAKGSLQDNATPTDGISALITSNSSFVPATFVDPTATLTVNAAGGGSKIQLGAMDNGFSPTTETFTGQAGDTFQFTSASAVPSAASVTLTTATLDLNGLSPSIDGLNGNGTITNKGAGASILSVGSNGDGGTFSGIIQDGTTKTVGLIKLGAGSETLSGANTYSGATTITGGTLQAGAANALSKNSDVADNATLDLKGASQTIGALSGTGSVTSSTAGAPTLTIGFDNNGATFSGTIKNGSAASVALTKTGSGAEIFTSTTNTYTGGTTVSAGILQIGDGANFGSVGAGGVSVTGTLKFDSPATSSASAASFANNISGAGVISLIAGAVVVNGNNTGFTGALNITGGSYQLGTGLNPLGASSGITSINISGAGQFYFGAATTLTVNAPVALAPTGTPFDTAGNVRFAGANDNLAGAVTVTGTALVSAFSASSGAIQGNITGTGTLGIGSGLSAETIILTGSDGIATTVNGDTTLQVGAGGTAGALSGSSVTDDGSLVFKRSDTATVGDSISGSGTLTQAGSGTLILPGANTYSYGGATTVSSGVLEVDGSISSNVSVSSSGTITGAGTIAGSVTSAGADFLSTAVSTLTTNALTLNAGSTFNIGIGGTVGSPVYSSDTVTSGAVNLNGVALNLATIGGYIPQGNDDYTIIANDTASNAINGTFVAGPTIDNFATGASLPEGADLSDNFMGTGRTAILTYEAGPNGDSVAIDVLPGTQFRYPSTAITGSHNFLLKEGSVGGVASFELYDNGTQPGNLVASQPLAVTLSSPIVINVTQNVSAGQVTDITQNDDASLTIDYSGGGVFANKVIFDGGTGSAAHSLTFENSLATTAITNEIFTYTGAHAGNVQLDAQPVVYSDLSSIADGIGVTTANVNLGLPGGAQATLGSSGVSQIVSQNFVTTVFADPSTLTVQTAGNSLVQLGAMDSGFSPTSESFTGLATDRFQLSSPSHLHSVTSVTLTTATLDLHGNSATLDALNGTGPIINSSSTAATLTIGADNDTGSFTGVIQNAINLTKNGAGTETLGAANTYSGATTIGAGKLVDGVPNALPIGTALNVTGTFDVVGNSQQVGSLSGTGVVTNSSSTAATFTVNYSNTAAADTFGGSLTAALTLTKQGAGTLILNGPDSYAGQTTIGTGTLTLANANALPANALVVNGTLNLFGISVTLPSVTGSGTVTNTSSTPATFTVNDGSADSFGGAITGSTTDSVALTKSGGGTLTLSKASTYSGVTNIIGGTIVDGIANALPTATSLTLSGTGTLNLAGFNQQVASVAGASTTTVTDSSSAVATFTVNNGTTDAFSGTLSNALALTKSGVGTLTLNGADSYTGPTTISAGTLQAGAAGALSNISDVTDNATLDVNGHSETVGALNGTGVVSSNIAGPVTLTIGNTGSSGVFSGVIKNGTGLLSLTKISGGVQTLAGANAYTGTTTLQGGTLTVNGSLYSSASPGTVNLTTAGVILNGTGTINGGVDLQASSFPQETHIDGVTITVPATADSVGITVANGATFAQIGVTKAVTVNGGNSTSTGILVSGSAKIFNSNISGHNIDVNVNGGSAALQKDILNAGTGSYATGLQAEKSAIVDAGQIATNATPLPTSQGYAAGNVGLYGDITGLFSGTPLGSSAHSTGGNTFNGYTASTATANPTVPQAIRDLNIGSASFGPPLPQPTNSVENSFTYGTNFHYGRMDLTAQANTFNSVASPTNAAIKSLIFDGQRNSAYGFVVYGLPTMTVTQTNEPSYVAPNNSYDITINVADTSALPSFGMITEDVAANETVNLAANPGWVNAGGGLYTYNVALIGAGSTGSVEFDVTVIAKPTVVTLTTEAIISVTGIVVGPANFISTTTTVSPNNIRWR
jgi:autotransporter-associated beta strand protein